eukprot:TRINITY_DN381_c0_g1_i2.p1 TRINITY_DN381_c0_g1~~TRINITY_DN381_c0_g1_i2.p1  ORF type:complete len:266 (+),score=51.26 TRINITY_DN381_c0_g1_i2:86-883(+)
MFLGRSVPSFLRKTNFTRLKRFATTNETVSIQPTITEAFDTKHHLFFLPYEVSDEYAALAFNPPDYQTAKDDLENELIYSKLYELQQTTGINVDTVVDVVKGFVYKPWKPQFSPIDTSDASSVVDKFLLTKDIARYVTSSELFSNTNNDFLPDVPRETISAKVNELESIKPDEKFEAFATRVSSSYDWWSKVLGSFSALEEKVIENRIRKSKLAQLPNLIPRWSDYLNKTGQFKQYFVEVENRKKQQKQQIVDDFKALQREYGIE